MEINEPEVPRHRAELAHFAAAAVAAMAIVPVLGCLGPIASEPGTESWWWWLYLLVALAATYLFSVALTHLREAWRGDDRSQATGRIVWRSAAIDLLVAALTAGILVRGPGSRLLLAGLGDGLPGLLAAATISAAIAVYSRYASHSEPDAPPTRGGTFHLLTGMTLVAALLAAEGL